jgi:hypothetical protein
MKHRTTFPAFVAVALVGMNAWADPWWASSTSAQAFPSSPTAVPSTGTQRDAQRAYSEARAECRGLSRDAQRDCINKSQQEYDKDRTMLKPPSGVRPPASSVMYGPR